MYLRDGSADNFTCCHTELEVADGTFYLIQSQYTDTWSTSPGADPKIQAPGRESHWSANFEVTGMTRPGKIPSPAGFEPRIFRSRGGRLRHLANEAVSTNGIIPNCEISLWSLCQFGILLCVTVVSDVRVSTFALLACQPPRWPSGEASASRAEDPGFESRLRRDFFGVESYQ